MMSSPFMFGFIGEFTEIRNVFDETTHYLSFWAIQVNFNENDFSETDLYY